MALSRRDLFRNTLTVAAAGAAGSWLMSDRALAAHRATEATAVAQTRPFLPYTADSFFKSRVTGAPVDATRTAAFRAFVKQHPDQRGYAYPRISGTGGSAWGTSYAMGVASDPIWKLTGTMNRACSVLVNTGFHAPEWLGDVLTGTSDSPFCVVDTASGFTVFGGKAKRSGARTISVLSAGITYHSSNGLHGKNPRSDDSRNFTSRGRLSDSMVIRKDLVDHGVANNTDLGHVLHLFLVETNTADGFCHPMVGDENDNFGFGAEGERLAIAPTVDLTKRGLSPEGLVIARTLQNYGCYIGDNAGSDSRLKAEQESAGHPVWGGRLNINSLKGITWDDFVVLPKGWHR